MDLTADTYQTGRGIYNALVKNIDALDKFTYKSWNRKFIGLNDYDSKELEIAISKTIISKEQKYGIDRAI